MARFGDGLHGGLRNARKIADVSAELLRYRGSTAPTIVAKALLARSLWGIELTRFLMLGLHDKQMRSWAQTMGYLTHLEPGLRTINWQGEGRRLTVDKLITAERFASADIPSAPLIAVIGRDSAEYPHAGRFTVVSKVESLTELLASCPDRLFVKPATGWRGDGVFGPERSQGAWRMNGATLSDRELAEHLLAAARPAGLLIQERVRSHRDLTPIGGQLGLGTVRINTALTSSGVEIVFVFAKIMGSQCLVDNFSGGKFGNMLAAVDTQSGALTQVFGRRRDQRFLMSSVNEHPVTGTQLVGFQLPLWTEAVHLAKRVASVFHEAPLVGADVAITDAGPLIIEVQSDWDANAAQLAMGKGLRPVLRELIPRLLLSDEAKRLAMSQMGLTGRAPRTTKVERHPRA